MPMRSLPRLLTWPLPPFWQRSLSPRPRSPHRVAAAAPGRQWRHRLREISDTGCGGSNPAQSCRQAAAARRELVQCRPDLHQSESRGHRRIPGGAAEDFPSTLDRRIGDGAYWNGAGALSAVKATIAAAISVSSTPEHRRSTTQSLDKSSARYATSCSPSLRFCAATIRDIYSRPQQLEEP